MLEISLFRSKVFWVSVSLGRRYFCLRHSWFLDHKGRPARVSWTLWLHTVQTGEGQGQSESSGSYFRRVSMSLGHRKHGRAHGIIHVGKRQRESCRGVGRELGQAIGCCYRGQVACGVQPLCDK